MATPCEKGQTKSSATPCKIHRVNTLNVFESKTLEPRMTLGEFMNVKFKNSGIPDLMFMYVYVLFGDYILEYFIKHVVKLQDTDKYFTFNPKYGLTFRSNDVQFAESEYFKRETILYVNEFFKEGGKVTYFKIPDGVGNFETKKFKKDDLIKIKRMFVEMADSRVKPGFNISRYSFHKHSSFLFGNLASTTDRSERRNRLVDINVEDEYNIAEDIHDPDPTDYRTHLTERIFLYIAQKNGNTKEKIDFQNFLDFCYEIYNESMSSNIRNRIAFDFYSASRLLGRRPPKERFMNPSLIFTSYELDDNNISFSDLESLLLFKTQLIDPRLKDEIYKLCDYLYSK